jgi:glycerol-3-phosphate dehydrogenase
VLGEATQRASLGRDFGGALTEREVEYVMANEWAQTAEDILWRRTKSGLHMTPAQRAAFEGWLREKR